MTSRMTSLICSRRLGPALALLLAGPWLSLLGQTNAVLNLAPAERLNIKRGGVAEFHLKADLRPGYHVNSNAPADEFLIPFKLTWAKEPLDTEQINYPKPQFEKYDFS